MKKLYGMATALCLMTSGSASTYSDPMLNILENLNNQPCSLCHMRQNVARHAHMRRAMLDAQEELLKQTTKAHEALHEQATKTSHKSRTMLQVLKADYNSDQSRFVVEVSLPGCQLKDQQSVKIETLNGQAGATRRVLTIKATMGGKKGSNQAESQAQAEAPQHTSHSSFISHTLVNGLAQIIKGEDDEVEIVIELPYNADTDNTDNIEKFMDEEHVLHVSFATKQVKASHADIVLDIVPVAKKD